MCISDHSNLFMPLTLKRLDWGDLCHSVILCLKGFWTLSPLLDAQNTDRCIRCSVCLLCLAVSGDSQRLKQPVWASRSRLGGTFESHPSLICRLLEGDFWVEGRRGLLQTWPSGRASPDTPCMSSGFRDAKGQV